MPAGQSDFVSLAGNFKPKFFKKLQDNRLQATPLLDRVRFDKRVAGISNEFDIPVPLTQHTGATYQAAGTAPTLNTPIPAVIKFAKVVNAEIVHQLPMPYGVIQAAANGDEVAYADLNMIKMLELGKGILRDQEISHLHGGNSLGQVLNTTGTAGTSLVIRLTDASWGEGLWKFVENSQYDIFSALSGGSQRNSIATLSLQSVNVSLKTLTLTGNATDIASVVANDVIFRRGAHTTAANLESLGLAFILSQTANTNLFNLDQTAFSAWRANQVDCQSNPLTFAKGVRGIASAVSGALKSDIVVTVSPPVWGGLMLDQAGLRRYPSKPGTFENGAPSVVLATETGKIEFISHPLHKDGEACAFPVKLAMRVGTTEPTDKIAGLNLEVMDATTASFFFRMFAGEAWFIEALAQCVYFKNVLAPS